MARRGKHKARLNWIVLLLVSAVVAFCLLNSLEAKHGLELGLPEISLPGEDLITDFLEGFGSGNGSSDGMDNALAVSGGNGSVVSGEVQVHVLDVGQAESILIRAPDKNVLIDAGENHQGQDVLRYLESQGVAQLHLVIGTHPHSDHIGGMDTVILGIPVEEVLLPVIPDDIVPTTKTYTDLLEAILEKELEITPAQVGLKYDLGGGAALEILGPLDEYGDLNNMSVAAKLTYGTTSFLFTGDAEAQAELDLVEQGVLGAQVLSIGHHGSSTSSTDAFLNAVNPKVALISCGLDNSYGHPHREVIERLQERGIEIYRTDLNGALVVSSNGEHLEIQTQK